MKDLAKDESEWIDYFIFELDWGKSYKDGMVTDENGKNIDATYVKKADIEAISNEELEGILNN